MHSRELKITLWLSVTLAKVLPVKVMLMQHSILQLLWTVPSYFSGNYLLKIVQFNYVNIVGKTLRSIYSFTLSNLRMVVTTWFTM